jgi:hypothetical protein
MQLCSTECGVLIEALTRLSLSLAMQLRVFKGEIEKLKANLNRAKLVGDSQQRHNRLPENLTEVRWHHMDSLM